MPGKRELKLKESTLKRLTKQTPRDMQPSELRCADSSKTTDRSSPSITGSFCFGGCLWKRQSCFGSDERGRAELEPVRRVFAKCLIKTFVASCGERVPKLNATFRLIANIRNALRVSVRLCWLWSQSLSEIQLHECADRWYCTAADATVDIAVS